MMARRAPMPGPPPSPPPPARTDAAHVHALRVQTTYTRIDMHRAVTEPCVSAHGTLPQAIAAGLASPPVRCASRVVPPKAARLRKTREARDARLGAACARHRGTQVSGHILGTNQRERPRRASPMRAQPAPDACPARVDVRAQAITHLREATGAQAAEPPSTRQWGHPFPDGHVRVQQYDQEGRIVSRCYEYTGALETRCYTATYDPRRQSRHDDGPRGDRHRHLRRSQPARASDTEHSTGEIEDYAFNTLGALSTNAGVVMNMQRPRLDGAGDADSAVPTTYNSLPVTLDLGGRITALNGDTLVYGQRNELRSVTEAGVTEFYGFDAFMRRIARYSSTTVTESYVYEGDENITEPQLGVASGQVASSRPVSTVGRSAASLIFSDRLSPQNIVATLDSSGGVVKSWLYDGVDHPLRMNLSGMIVYYEVDLAGNVRRLRDALGDDLGGYRYHGGAPMRSPWRHALRGQRWPEASGLDVRGATA